MSRPDLTELYISCDEFDEAVQPFDDYDAAVRDLQRVASGLATCREQPANHIRLAVEMLESYVNTRLAHHRQKTALLKAAHLEMLKSTMDVDRHD